MKKARSAKIYEPTTILSVNREIVIDERCVIGQHCFIAPRKLVMEDKAEICPQVTISGGGDVHLGKASTICFGARLIPATFSIKGVYMNDPIRREFPDKTKIIRGSITLKEGSYIGSNAVICVSEKNPHITIGRFAVVGALSYIDHDVADEIVVHPYQPCRYQVRGNVP